MDERVPFDTRKWLKEIIVEAAKASGNPRSATAQLKKIVGFLPVKNYNHIYPKYITGKKATKKSAAKEALQLTRNQVIGVAEILGRPNPFDVPEMNIPPGFALYKFYGEVQAGHLQEPDAANQDVPEPQAYWRHPTYPNATPMAWNVVGDSMDIEIPDGSVAFGVDFQEAGGIAHNDDIVVVEHILDGRIERTIKMVRHVDDGIELYPRSHNPKYRPIKLKSLKSPGAEIRIRSLIHGHDKNHARRRP